MQNLGQVSVQFNILREYRTRLVADVVTGKLDVREAAARLPQDEVEPVLEADDLAEDEDGVDDELTEAEA